MFMNEYEIDEAVNRYAGHSILGPATRFLAAYRDEVNRKSDGWPYWGSKAANRLMELIYAADPWANNRREPTEAEVKKAVASVKAFCTKHKLTCPEYG